MKTAPTNEQRDRTQNCATCNGWWWNVRLAKWLRSRETSGLVCQTCGWDYGEDGEP